MATVRAPFVLLAAVLAVGCAPTSYDRAPAYEPTARSADDAAPPVSVVVESGGGAFPTYAYGGALFVAGDEGARYSLRLVNHTAERYEAVVSVDGRDVVSGELGNYKQQRGYIIEPFGSVVIDGYRRSLDEVAAFRFSTIGDGYSARRGTPEHSGVIGVALFEEKRRRSAAKPIAVGPRGPARPFPAAKAGGGARTGEGADEPEVIAPAEHTSDDGVGIASAPSAERPAELGTAYGESDYSPVHEVEFERRRKRRPDGVLTLYYDSHAGLAARGVIPARVDPYEYRRRDAEPGFAPAP